MPTRRRLLVIGGGSIGERHVRCFQHTGRVDVLLCEIDQTVRETVSERYAVSRSFADLREALTASPDLALVCTPAHLHVPMATELLEAGIPTLIEKPLSTGLDGVHRLCRAAQEWNLTAAVAYVYRAHPALAAMQAAIRDKRFGEPLQIVAVFGQHFPYYRPAYREIYYNDRRTGGGAVQDALTHVLNAGEWLVGSVTALTADADHLRLEGVDVEDTVHVLARHGRVLGNYSLNQHQPANEGTITVVCEHGMARFEMHRHRWMWVAGPQDGWHVEPPWQLQRDDLFIRQAEAFLDAVDGRREPLCPLAEGVQTLRANLAVLASLESGTWQRIEREP